MDRKEIMRELLKEMDLPYSNAAAENLAKKIFLLKPVVSKEMETQEIIELLSLRGVEALGNFDEEEAKLENIVNKMFNGTYTFDEVENELINKFKKLRSTISNGIQDLKKGVLLNTQKETYLKDLKQSFFEEARLHSLKGDINPFCVGGSDTAAIIGVSPWVSPIKLYSEKLGKIPRKKVSKEQEIIYSIGHEFEAPARNLFTQISDLETREFPIQVRNKKYPHIVANIDGLVFENGEIGIYEGKTTNPFSSTKDSFLNDICPEYYLSQIQLYMEVWDVDFCYINCIWGIHTNNFKYLRIPRDREYGEMICQACEEFVKNAMIGIAPTTVAQDPSLIAKDALEVYGLPVKHSKPIILNNSCSATVKRLATITKEKEEIEQKIKPENDRLKALSKEETNLKNTLILHMKNSSEGMITIDDNTYAISYNVKQDFSFDASVKGKFREKYPDIYDWVSHLKEKATTKITFKKINS